MRARRQVVALVGLSLVAACSKKGTSTLGLKVGQCIVTPTTVTAQVGDVKTIPCAQSHTEEVFALPRYAPAAGTSDATYAGDQVLKAYAEGACAEQFQAYVGVSYPDSKLFFTYLLPSPRSWSDGDRTVVCIIQSTMGPQTTSAKGTKG